LRIQRAQQHRADYCASQSARLVLGSRSATCWTNKTKLLCGAVKRTALRNITTLRYRDETRNTGKVSSNFQNQQKSARDPSLPRRVITPNLILLGQTVWTSTEDKHTNKQTN